MTDENGALAELLDPANYILSAWSILSKICRYPVKSLITLSQIVTMMDQSVQNNLTLIVDD